MKIPVLLLAVASQLAAPAVGQTVNMAVFDERLSLNVADAKPVDVFASFGQILGAAVELDPAVTGRVTLRLERVSVRTTLDAICESIECRWSVPENAPLRLRIDPRTPSAAKSAPAASPDRGSALDEKMSIHLEQAAASDVLFSFGQILRARLDIHPSLLAKKVTIGMDSAPAREVLDQVCAQLECTWTLSEVEPRLLTFTPATATP